MVLHFTPECVANEVLAHSSKSRITWTPTIPGVRVMHDMDSEKTWFIVII